MLAVSNSNLFHPVTQIFEFGPENCDSYDGCATIIINGTLSGTLREYGHDADAVQMVDNAWLYANHAVLETQHGTLTFIERAVADYDAPDRYTVHMYVVEVTGRYEGATGWMGTSGDVAATRFATHGLICWGDEE